jgi:RHS repeat-associated protein
VSSPHGEHGYTYVPNRPQLLATHTSPVHVTTRTYDPGRTNVAKIENKVGAALISGYTYTLNNANQRVERAQAGTAFAAPSADVFAYNPKGELVESANTVNAAYDRSFLYDDIGNRLTSITTSGTTSYTSNSLNQYAGILAPSSSLQAPSYDADGNQSAIGDGQLYTWDGENRLIAVEPVSPPTGDQKVVNTYDGQGRRVRRVVSAYNGSTWDVVTDEKFIYDGWNVVAVLDSSTQSTLRLFTWGTDLSGSMQGAGGVGGLLSASDGGFVYHYTYDANGNVSEVLDSSGSTVAHYEYDAFGNTVAANGTYATANDYRFSTKPLDATSGLYYYGLRYYDPKAGRWTRHDSLGEAGGVNLYGLLGNQPINKADYLGMVDYAQAPNMQRLQRVRDQFLSSSGTVQGLGLSVSGQMMAHYIKGGGNHFALSESFAMAFPELKQAIEKNNKRILDNSIDDALEHMEDAGLHTYTKLDWWDATASSPRFDGNRLDHQFSIQGFTVTSYVKIELKTLPGFTGCQIKTTIDHLMWDYYDFNAGSNIPIPGTPGFSGDDLNALADVGLAKKFYSYAWFGQYGAGIQDDDGVSHRFGPLKFMNSGRIASEVIAAHPSAARLDPNNPPRARPKGKGP